MEIWVKYRVLLVALLALGGAMVVPEGEAAPVAAENREALVKQYLQKAHDLEREGRSREAISYLDSAEKLGCDRPMVYWLRQFVPGTTGLCMTVTSQTPSNYRISRNVALVKKG